MRKLDLKSPFLFVAGEHIRDKYDYYHETDHWISVIHLHSRFLADQEYAYDIALLKIYPPASISSAVYPISLPKLFEQVPVGTKCTMSGTTTIVIVFLNEFHTSGLTSL